jgi:hypothetical protein
VGVGMGLMPDMPLASADLTELRAPIAPQGQPVLGGLAGFRVHGIDVAGASMDRAAHLQYYGLATGCHAGSDGDCTWRDCPQKRDGEPELNGRHCPLDVRHD